MTSTARTQTRTTCTMADLRAWEADVEIDIPIVFEPHLAVCADRVWPRCLGCGGPFIGHRDGALTIDSHAKTLTFRPCGCILTVTDMPEGWTP